MKKIRRKMGKFLKLISMEEAFERIENTEWKTLRKETISVSSSLGRISASDIFAKKSFPAWNRSLVDGFAVKISDCVRASDTNPVTMPVNGVIEAGKSRFGKYIEKNCTEIYTGGIVPDDYDAVIMVEDCVINEGNVTITSVPKQWDNIERAGDDLKEGEKIMSSPSVIKPWNITAMVSSGVEEIEVFEKIRVGVIATGNELFSDAEGSIPNTTQNLIVNYLQRGFIEAEAVGIAHDDSNEIREMVENALKRNHCAVITGGTSLGGKDEVPEAVSEISQVVFGGVMIRPGRTMTLYESDGKPVFSVSGVPVPSMLSFDLFFEQYVKSVTGLKDYRKALTARLSSKVSNKAGYAGIYRVQLLPGDDGEVAEVIKTHGSGSINSMLKSDGTLIIPGTVEGLEAGQIVKVKLFGDC